MLSLQRKGLYCYLLPLAKGKRTSPPVISTAHTRAKDGTQPTSQRRLVITIFIPNNNGNRRSERAFINSGAEANLINQTLVKDAGLQPLVGTIEGLSTIDGKELWNYGVYEIDIKATDSGNATESFRHPFVAVDFSLRGVNIVLGYL